MNRDIKYKIVFLVWVLLIGFFSYMAYFETYIKSKRYVNEIINLKVDSISVSEYSRGKSYTFYIDGKYLMRLDSTKFIPFKQSGGVDLVVKDINSNYVIADFLTSNHDMNRMIKYATNNIKK